MPHSFLILYDWKKVFTKSIDITVTVKFIIELILRKCNIHKMEDKKICLERS